MAKKNEKRRSSSRGSAFWRRAIQRWEKSGQSQRAFCDLEGLALSTFCLWRRRLAAADAANTEPETEPPATELERQGFVTVEIAGEPATRWAPSQGFEILFPSGLRLRMPGGCDGRSLAEVLWALEASGQC